jgi:hypothetical protein
MISPLDHGRETSPIAIGGVGGSGTRLVAEMMRALGIAMGDDLNHASDNLWFSLLFSRNAALDCGDAEFDAMTSALVSGLSGREHDPAAAVLIRVLADDGRPQHPSPWLQERAASLLQAMQDRRERARWGWKEPNTHMFIERLWQRIPNLKYVHVVRNGMDMAYSRNQRQVQFWGPAVLGSDGPLTPARSLSYWCRVHQKVERLLADNRERMFWLDYDAFCADPGNGIRALLQFIGHDDGPLERLAAMIQPGTSRRPAHGALDGFEPDDLAYLRSLGYAPDHDATGKIVAKA